MVYENDYILRQIQLFAQYIAKTVFNKDSVWYLPSAPDEITETDILHQRLLELISENRFCEAEDMLFSEFCPESKTHLAIALDFYSRLADVDDRILEENDFSKEEILSGLKEISKISFFGITVDAEDL